MTAFDEAWAVIKEELPTKTMQMTLPDSDGVMKPSPDWELYDARYSGRSSEHLPSFRTWRRLEGKAPTQRALPAELQYEPSDLSSRLRLVDDNNNLLSFFDIDPIKNPDRPALEQLQESGISGFYGHTIPLVRRQGQYRTLFNNALRHGIDIISDSRGKDSQGFHRNYMNTLPGDIQVSGDRGRIGYDDPLFYSAKPAWFPEGWGDLRGPHNIQVPFRELKPDVEPVRPTSVIVAPGEDGGVKPMKQTRLPPFENDDFSTWGFVDQRGRSVQPPKAWDISRF